MRSLKPRSDLPIDVQEALVDLRMKFRSPFIILRLKNGILTQEESRSVGEAGISEPAEPRDWVCPRKVIEVVARQRQLTLERALLELCRSLDLIGVGRYEQLRKAIGDPV